MSCVAIQASGGGGITGGDPGISITHYQSVTNAPNIDKLNDAYYQVGGSVTQGTVLCVDKEGGFWYNY